MPQVGEIMFHLTGDVGGTGVARFRFIRQDSGNIQGSDAHAAAVAAQNVLGAATQWTPLSVRWDCSPQCNVYDIASGLVQGPLSITSLPAAVVGAGSGTYASGTGARLNWRTSTIVGRRLIRGATFLAPLTGAAFTTGGSVAAATQTQINTGPANYLTAMAAAALEAVVWHRPLKGLTSGGVVGVTFSGLCSAVPSSLRSRRH
jgi:hypothetical protein